MSSGIPEQGISSNGPAGRTRRGQKADGLHGEVHLLEAGDHVVLAVLDDAETDIVNVWAYEAGGPTAYPAEKQNVSIQIDEFGGDGGSSVKINYTINFIGDPVPGTFNANTSAFTPS